MVLRALLAAAAVTAFAAAGGSAASVRVPPKCDRGVETTDGNPPPTPTPVDLFVGHRLVLVGAATPKTHEVRDRRGGWWWLKTLVIVRGGRAVTLTVPRSERGRLRLRYLSDARMVTFRPCRRPVGQWSYYPGGFVYSQRGCYALDIRIEPRRTVRRYIPLGVGARCAT
jgi:hypothetical protein